MRSLVMRRLTVLFLALTLATVPSGCGRQQSTGQHSKAPKPSTASRAAKKAASDKATAPSPEQQDVLGAKAEVDEAVKEVDSLMKELDEIDSSQDNPQGL